MARARLNPSWLLLILLPSPAFASGDVRMLLFPLGNVLAIYIILALSAASAIRWPGRVVAVIAAFSISAWFWFTPALPSRSGWFYFLIGILPPLAAGSFVMMLFRNKRAKHNGA